MDGLNFIVDLVNIIPTTVKPPRGHRRKSLGVPHLAMNLTRHVPEINIDTLHDTSVMQPGSSSHNRKNLFEHSKPVLDVEQNSAMPIDVSIPTAQPICPIFTPIKNSDFNSDNNYESDYDPFATHQYEDESISDFEEHKPPFSINRNCPTSSEEYYDIGDLLIECCYCKVMMWYQERMNKSSHFVNPKFSLCYDNGKVELSLLKQPPELLSRLLFYEENIVSRKSQQQIHIYNMMFTFTSPGAKLDNRFNNGGGPPTLQIQGQLCHQIGSFLPPEGQPPKFAQNFISLTLKMKSITECKV
ncbi:hypothetical protein KIW84_053003 [Lathyrus oleraceus]|uniref:Uncharacterized protein n=1 Tax=Pisum sativum TaxID=3888 RepID=A0A9D5AG08_PEA|nr:hypothetical protein KIW84_053003 [Pisum sativum]